MSPMILRCFAAAALVVLSFGARAAQTELTGVTQLSAGPNRVCALTNAGAVKCWGAAPLGDGSTSSRWVAAQVSGLESGVVAIGVGGARGGDATFPPTGGHACAVMGTGGIKCWGANSSGQLGDGSTADRSAPVDVQSLASGVAARRMASPASWPARRACALMAAIHAP
jgi:hypothetical protein